MLGFRFILVGVSFEDIMHHRILRVEKVVDRRASKIVVHEYYINKQIVFAIQDISYSSLLVPSNRNFAKLVTVNDTSTVSISESSQSSQGILTLRSVIALTSHGSFLFFSSFVDHTSLF